MMAHQAWPRQILAIPGRSCFPQQTQSRQTLPMPARLCSLQHQPSPCPADHAKGEGAETDEKLASVAEHKCCGNTPRGDKDKGEAGAAKTYPAEVG